MKQCFTIPMVPVAKGRPRVVRRGDGGSMTYTPDRTVSGEETLKWHLRSLGASPCQPGAAVSIQMTFAIRRPKSKKKTRAPITRPDLDNYVKLVTDASIGLLFQDDSQIVNMQANKVYAEDEPYILLQVEEL